MPQEPKRPVSELKPSELRTIVHEILKLLWVDEYATDEQRSNGGVTRFWNAEKALSIDTLAAIVTLLEEHGLTPIDPPTVQGFDSVDQFLEALPKDTPLPDDYGDSQDPEDWTPHAKPSS
jgi:hypothetical protein